MVHDLIKSKGLSLGRERKDHYVNELFKFMKKDGVVMMHYVNAYFSIWLRLEAASVLKFYLRT
jgi:hypothetical protein